jgi:hypothetical protein
MVDRSNSKRIAPIDPSLPLRSCQKVQSSMYWPAPIDARLNQLVDAAVEAGERLSKADVIGALVLVAPNDPEELGRLVRAYRRTKAGDILRAPVGADVIVFEERRSGQRPHR